MRNRKQDNKTGGLAEQFIKVGERVQYLGQNRSKRSDWPEDAWLENGVLGTVIEYHKETPAVVVAGEYYEALPPYAVVQWDLGENVKTCIDIDNENTQWKRAGIPIIISNATV